MLKSQSHELVRQTISYSFGVKDKEIDIIAQGSYEEMEKHLKELNSQHDKLDIREYKPKYMDIPNNEVYYYIRAIRAHGKENN